PRSWLKLRFLENVRQAINARTAKKATKLFLMTSVSLLIFVLATRVVKRKIFRIPLLAEEGWLRRAKRRRRRGGRIGAKVFAGLTTPALRATPPLRGG